MKVGIGKKIIGVILAFFAGLFTPFVLLAPIFMMAFYAWTGISSALVFALSCVLSGYMYSGGFLALIFFVGFILPTALQIGRYQKEMPFFKQQNYAVVSQFIAGLAVVVLTYLRCRMSVAELLILRYKDAVTMAVSYINMAGAEVDSPFAQYIIMIEQNIDNLTNLLSAALPSVIPSIIAGMSIVIGTVGPAWQSAIARKRGENKPYVPLNEWFVPNSVTVYAMITIIFFRILAGMNVSGTYEVLSAAVYCATVICEIQACASLYRRMKRNGQRPGMRKFIITIGILFASTFMTIIGGLSLLFGSRGLITTLIKKKRENSGFGNEEKTNENNEDNDNNNNQDNNNEDGE